MRKSHHRPSKRTVCAYCKCKIRWSGELRRLGLRGQLLVCRKCHRRLASPADEFYPPSVDRNPAASMSGLERRPSAPAISVVIPTYNRSRSLVRTLIALSHQTRAPAEVVVVDDGSEDETTAAIRRLADGGLPFSLRVVRQRRNRGPAAARNRGVAIARGEVVAFTDDDCEPAVDWLEQIACTLGTDHQVVGVGGTVRSAGDSPFDLFFDHFELLNPRLKAGGGGPMYLVTANAAYVREWVLKVGGFDEALRKAGGEDPGLAFKIRAAGGQIAFNQRAVVLHHYPRTLRSLARMFWNYGYGGNYVARAHPIYD